MAGTHAAARRALPDGSVPPTSKDPTAHKHNVKPDETQLLWSSPRVELRGAVRLSGSRP